MTEPVVNILLLTGSLFCAIAGIGIVRFQNLYMRIHAATKAGAFGGSLIALAYALHFSMPAIWVKAVLLIVFFYITAPVAAHMLSRQRFHRNKQRVAEGEEPL